MFSHHHIDIWWSEGFGNPLKDSSGTLKKFENKKYRRGLPNSFNYVPDIQTYRGVTEGC
jgi:hypothetical protein